MLTKFILKLILIFFIFSLVVGSVILIDRVRIKNGINSIRETYNLTEVESIKQFIPDNQILLENMVAISPFETYVAFVTMPSLSMENSTLWVVKSDGSDIYKIALGDGYRVVTSPVWSPDGNRLAYFRIYPSELRVINLSNGNDELVYSNSIDSNLLNPSIGFANSVDLSWLSNDEIIFENMLEIPEAYYSIDVESKEIKVIDNITEPEIIYPETSIDLHSQRDGDWNSERLGTCDNHTIGSAGCAIAALSMMLNAAGNEINPSTLNQLLTTEVEGYFNGCDIRWNIIPNLFPNVELKAIHFGKKGIDILDYEVEQGNLVILGFDEIKHNNIPHWVFVKRKTSSGRYEILDPWETDSEKRHYLDEYYPDEMEDEEKEEIGPFDHLVVYRIVD